MGSDKKIFDDLARLAGGAVNIMSGLQQQVRDEIRSRFDEFAARLDLVPREDFDALQARVDALSKKVAGFEKLPAKTSAPKKPPAKKSTGKKS